MNKEAPQSQFEHKLSSFHYKAFCFIAIALFATGCATDPSLNPDDYYASVDSSVATAMAQEQMLRQAESNITFAGQQKPIETSKPQTLNLTNDILCATVAPGGSVSQAVEDANNGVFPPFTINGLALQVRFIHSGKLTIMGLEKVMTAAESPIVDPGDQVCISTAFH